MADSATLPPPTENELALLKAAFEGDLKKVQTCVAGGANINVQASEFDGIRGHQNVTPLMCAALKGHVEVVRWLLEHKANYAAETILPKSEGGPGTQAIHFAATNGHEAVIAALLDAGANPNAEGKFGRTPLTVALRENKLGCAKLLLARSASASVKSRHKQFDPPLAILAANVSNVTSLVSRNGKLVPEAKDLWDQKEIVFELFQLLLTAGADPNAKSSSGSPPLTYFRRGIPDDISLPIMRMLLEKDANPNLAGKSDNPPLMIAALYNRTSIARLLLEYPVDVNSLCQRGTVLDVIESDIKTAEEDIESVSDKEGRAEFENKLRDLNAFRDLLISKGGKRKSELGAVAETPAKVEKTHIASDFLKLVNTGEAEWALLAVKAPFDVVSDAYFKFAKAKDRQKNVPANPAKDGEEIPPLVAVVKVKDSPWTIILRTIFYVRSPDLKHVAAVAKELSDSLKTKAITWAASNETDNGRCEVFENGEKTASANNAKSIALLTKEELHVPACYPTREGKKFWLAVEKPSFSLVERADLIARS